MSYEDTIIWKHVLRRMRVTRKAAGFDATLDEVAAINKYAQEGNR